MNIAIVIIFLTAVAALLLGLRARRGREMNLEEWSVGGRSFGTVLVFILLAGEFYRTTFSFLGAKSGFAYGKGGGRLLHALRLSDAEPGRRAIGCCRESGAPRGAERLVSQPQFLRPPV